MLIQQNQVIRLVIISKMQYKQANTWTHK